MEGIEASGKTVEEAVEDALQRLGLSRDEVEVEVLSKGGGGILHFGGGEARVRVTPRGETEIEEGEAAEPRRESTPAVSLSPEEQTDLAIEVLEKLLDLMGIDAQVVARAPETPGDGVGLTDAVLDVTGEDLGVLIGRRGGTMAALQYIVNLIVSRKTKERTAFAVDVEGYRRRREQALTALANRIAERVRQTGRTLTLEPMPANERRIVHLALSNDATVITVSVGEGESRKVAIALRK